MKLYTRRGDDGLTRLLEGSKVPKHSLRIEVLGTVEELNCVLGLAGTSSAGIASRRRRSGTRGAAGIGRKLEAIQRRLFDMSGELACPANVKVLPKLRRIRQADVRQMEQWIDGIWAKLPPLKRFILPGGSETAARLHVARAVCRRAERMVVALAQKEAVNPHILAYLNRLSDFLFALARWANQQSGMADRLWKGHGGTHRATRR